MILLALVTNAALVYAGTYISPEVTLLLIVYEGWLGFLTYLNWYMWRYNGGERFMSRRGHCTLKHWNPQRSMTEKT